MPAERTPRRQGRASSLYSSGSSSDMAANSLKLGVRPEEDSVLRPGAHRSIEFSARTAVPEWNGETVLIPMEDDAYLTEKGYVYFRPYQTEWYLIR